MRLFVITVITFSLWINVILAKSSEKTYPKKVTSTAASKPTKAPKSAIDEFTALPPEDFEFIKELDKQFKIHGDKIKIKIEKDNSTAVGKNSKRTIDGSLGYGYHTQSNEHPYYFSKPKYMIYPYSQRDIPPIPAHRSSGYGTGSVEIQQSNAFELKEVESDGYQYSPPSQQLHYPQPQPVYQQQLAEQYAEPVIVLRVPGPTKYASHLQALLQQYLEIRAAQYIRAFQEVEAQQQQQHHQEDLINYHQQTAQAYLPTYQEQPIVVSDEREQSQHYEPAEPSFPPPEEVYQTKYRLQKQQEEHIHQHGQPQEQHNIYQPINTDSQEYSHQSEHHQPQINNADYEQDDKSQGVSSLRYVYPTRPIYVPDSTSHSQISYQHDSSLSYASAPAHTQYASDSSPLHISENYPSRKHTKVVFTGKENSDHSTAYPLPPLPTPIHHHHQHHQSQQVSEQSEAAYASPETYQDLEPRDNQVPEESVISITQRPRGPHNYHAHPERPGYKTNKRNAPSTRPYTEEEFKKLGKLITRLKKKNPVVQ